jgi:competence ComEA-like helix-hairpin-helix protein
MKTVLIALVSLFATLSLAQMPDAAALKANANSAIDTGAKNSEKAQVDAKQTLDNGKSKVAAVKEKALVNLNTASKEDLAKLPGIGPVRAQSIVDARPYNDVTDLKKVKGIGAGTIAKLKGLVTTK